MELLWARYQPAAVGRWMNSTIAATAGEDGTPESPETRNRASAVSRIRPSLSARHHGLPG